MKSTIDHDAGNGCNSPEDQMNNRHGASIESVEEYFSALSQTAPQWPLDIGIGDLVAMKRRKNEWAGSWLFVKGSFVFFVLVCLASYWGVDRQAHSPFTPIGAPFFGISPGFGYSFEGGADFCLEGGPDASSHLKGRRDLWKSNSPMVSFLELVFMSLALGTIASILLMAGVYLLRGVHFFSSTDPPGRTCCCLV